MPSLNNSPGIIHYVRIHCVYKADVDRFLVQLYSTLVSSRPQNRVMVGRSTSDCCLMLLHPGLEKSVVFPI